MRLWDVDTHQTKKIYTFDRSAPTAAPHPNAPDRWRCASQTRRKAPRNIHGSAAAHLEHRKRRDSLVGARRSHYPVRAGSS